MIAFSDVSSNIWIGRKQRVIFSGLTMKLPTDRRLAVLVKSADMRSDLVQLICDTKDPDGGSISRDVRVSYPVGFSTGLYSKLTVLGNINFVATLYGIDRDAFADLVIPLLGDNPQLHTHLADLPGIFRSHFGYCLSYALPFDVYVTTNVVMPADDDLRGRLLPLIEARLQNAGLIVVTASASVAQSMCHEAAVLHEERLMPFPSVKAAVSFFRETETARDV